MATSENRPWWSPIIISLFGFAILISGAPTWHFLQSSLFNALLNALVLLLGIFLILLILIQRGKGGGLAGAFGGVGGSSPFGSRAGDAFTRYTITFATLWLWLVMLQVRVIQESFSPS